MELIRFEEIHKHAGIEVSYQFGLIREVSDVKIFLLENDSHNYFIDHAPNILLAIHKHYDLENEWHEYKWSFVAGAAYSEIIIESKHNTPTTITFLNAAVLKPYCSAFKAATYINAILDSRSLQDALLDGYPANLKSSFTEASTTFYLVHTPRHKKYLFHMIKPWYCDLEKFPVVLVNSEKFISYWKQQREPLPQTIFEKLIGKNPSYKSIDCDDEILLSSTVEISLRYSIPATMAENVHFDHENKIRFGDGRHRTVNIANMGAPFIPVQVSNDNLEIFIKAFEF